MSKRLNKPKTLGPVAWVVIGFAAVTIGGCSYLWRPSTREKLSHPFTLTVEESRRDTGFHAPTDSIYETRFESQTSHFGRIEAAGREPDMTLEVFSDSIRFRQERPFGIEAFMSLDKHWVTSKRPRSGSDLDQSMLECLFAGPSVRITFSDDGKTRQIDHPKSDCPGGIYQRLNLPDLFRFLVVWVPPHRRDVGNEWEITEAIPSLSGIGYSPRLYFRYRVTEPDAQPRLRKDYFYVTYECDSIIRNDRTTMPNGATVDILSNHVVGGGHLIVDRDSGFPVAGTVGMNEDIHYVHPDLESPVLKKVCRYHASLAHPSRPWLASPGKSDEPL